MRPLSEVSAELGLGPEQWIPWGEGAGKVRLEAWKPASSARFVLVTAMSPTPAGEGKTTVAIGLNDALRRLGKRSVVCLRQPSMGPVFGSKGGGTGAGRAQLWPGERINLHFTGDMHAITSAHNLLAAALDNHLHFGNGLGLDVRRLLLHRVLDQNDRALRSLVVGLGDVPRQDRFDITASSEVMAVLALARDYDDLKARLGGIIVGVNQAGGLVRARDLRAQGAMAVLLKEALMPNLVQTLEGTPALVHCGPFANIAHGTSSVVATRLALARAEVVVQEAGFGAELGAEKFLDIFCRELGRFPEVAVVVVTARALALHGEENLRAHLALLDRLGLPHVVALNEVEGESFPLSLPHVPVRVYQEGGAGALELGQAVLAATPGTVRPLYAPGDALEEKVRAVFEGAYGAGTVEYAPHARVQLSECSAFGYGGAYVCVAKSQKALLPEGPVRAVYLLGGAGFVVPVCGDLSTMPALGRAPRLERMDLTGEGGMVGL